METEKDNLQPQDKNQEGNDKILSTEEKIQLIENQLHVINTKLHNPEKKHWWKQNIPLFISIIALMASIGFNSYGVFRDQSKDSQSTQRERAIAKAGKIEEINQLILKLTDLQEKNIKLASENPNVDVTGLSVLSNYERLIYVNKILNLIDSLDTKFPPEVYALIGNELRYDGQFVKARRFYFDELANANTATSKVVAYRDLANIFGIPETGFQNIDSSRRFWRNSIIIADSIIGEQKYHYKGYGYQLWAGNEFFFGNPKLAMELIDSAKQSYSKLPGGNTAKEYNIRRLSQMVEFYNSRNVNSRLHCLAGEWKQMGNRKQR